jgi:predicted RNA-binding Zn ribbon-like protein
LLITLQVVSQKGRTLDDLFAVANSLHGRDAHAHLDQGTDLAPGERHDHLRDPRSARAFLRAQDIAVPAGDPTRAELRSLRIIRDGVYRLAGPDAEVPGELLTLFSRQRYRLTTSGALRPEGHGWSAMVGDLLVLFSAARVLGERLKRCANRDCGWIFVDASKNRSRQWCETRTCGNRANVRRFRARLRRGARGPKIRVRD